ncbi:hypothetical protein [Paraburkholderia sp. JHI869]|uniref:hypothetical protein n=1 Tax=Paraburkholderia sp. JHI869 TaxID=3112959 RepID=UPI00317BA7D8
MRRARRCPRVVRWRGRGAVHALYNGSVDPIFRAIFARTGAPAAHLYLRDLHAAFTVVRPLAAYVPLYGSLWLMAIASDALDPASVDETTLQARATERELGGLRYYDPQLHSAFLKASCTARDKLGEFLQL